ncbi:MAG: HEPN domain-containing protein [Marinilabiliaceae bacterium]|nr:HEPN domain-containing protein [Marinilabiliaceae bacterium]
MDKKEELKQWFSLAKQNFDVAKYLANNMHPIPVETICNQCQQSAEKDLKGYLFFNDIEFPKTHDLRALLTLCVNLNPDFAKFRRQTMYLNNFSVLPKYPNELQITEDDAKTAIRFTDEIKEFCQKLVQ